MDTGLRRHGIHLKFDRFNNMHFTILVLNVKKPKEFLTKISKLEAYQEFYEEELVWYYIIALVTNQNSYGFNFPKNKVKSLTSLSVSVHALRCYDQMLRVFAFDTKA